MDKKHKKMREFGLLGRNISYSFSREYFKQKFEKESITDAMYGNFDIDDISKLPSIIKTHKNLKGLNVTIPYKEDVIPYLDHIDTKAKNIGAINTIKISKEGKLTGYNTDYYGFEESLKPLLNNQKTALILGTGGASKAIAYSLKNLGISYDYVSRKLTNNVSYDYSMLNDDIIKNHPIIINCTPLGTHPNIADHPEIPYNAITNNHILFDLIYNPEETTFLKLGKKQGAVTINGLNMLILQAEKAWEIWNSI